MKVPFLIRKGFKIVDRAENGKLFIEMIPKKNLWFYLFAFIEAFKTVCKLEYFKKSEEE